MNDCISQEFVGKYLDLRQQNSKIVWTNSRNFIPRIFDRNKAYQELVNEDIKFSTNIIKMIENHILENSLNVNDLEKIILSFRLHISKNTERVKFLISFPFILTLILIFEKLDLLKIILPNPFNIILIIFYSFLMIFAFGEKTKMTEYRHSLKELIEFLEYQINIIKDNKT